MNDFPDPWLLDRLMCECALMRHHVAYGVPPALYRICGKGHVVLLRSGVVDSDRCRRCESIARANRQRRSVAA